MAENSNNANQRKKKPLQDYEKELGLGLTLRGHQRQSLSELTPFQRMFSQPFSPPPKPIEQTPFQHMFSRPPPPSTPTLPFQIPCINIAPQDVTASTSARPLCTQLMLSQPPPPPTPTLPLPIPYINITSQDVTASSTFARPIRSHRAPAQNKGPTVPAPFPWATHHRAIVHSLKYLCQNGIFNITGEVQCKRCDKKFEMTFDLREKFTEIWNLFARDKITMYQRAPSYWMNPILSKCEHCNQENSVKPIIAEKKKDINWLFLLLGQMLGCCTLEQLKYFCKHTNNHRTGAKDRVLYLTYLGLCKQLDPEDPKFDL